MHSPVEILIRDELADFFSSFNETCFSEYTNASIYLDLISKLCARYGNDCSFIFQQINLLDEKKILNDALIHQIIINRQLTALQLYKTLKIIEDDHLNASQFNHIALVQMLSLEQKKVMDVCCHLELFEESYAERLCRWIYNAQVSPLLFKLLDKLKVNSMDLFGIVEYADQFPEEYKFHVFIGITTLEQYLDMDSNIVKLFDKSQDPLLLTEILLQAQVLEVIRGPQKEGHLELILNHSAPELMLLTLQHIHLLKLPPSLETSIKQLLSRVNLSELSKLRQAFKLLLEHPKHEFRNWQVIIEQPKQAPDIINLFLILSRYQMEHELGHFIDYCNTITIAMANDMLIQMLRIYPYLSYHLHFFQFALPHSKDGSLSFHLYIKLLNHKLFLHHLPPDKFFKLLFTDLSGTIVDLLISYKQHELLAENSLFFILTDPVLELLEQASIQQVIKHIDSKTIISEVFMKHKPEALIYVLDCLRILQESNLLTGYDTHRNLRLLGKSSQIRLTAEQLKALEDEHSISQEGFERVASCLPSIFKQNQHPLTELSSAKGFNPS